MKSFTVLLLSAVLLSAACNGKKQEKSQRTQGTGSGAEAQKAAGTGAQGPAVNQEMTAQPEGQNQNPPGFANGGGDQAPRQGAPPPEPASGEKKNKGNVSYGNPAGSKPQSTKPSQ